ncbi:triacylglycerol lipase [Massilia sp. YIM B02443]|uniref:esterase/lipase family protein n=1 Tax=Massilia sp. YIM B02443 TaxID=3050127 RepID=UPI0025B6301C|nr:hypothetical protein [Massilia sp. YIM B02443]MDN4035490.1 hypothetical protein [Massilia sp. YIM B02443]
MPEPTRPLRDPRPNLDGSLTTHSVATPVAFRIRGAVYVGSRRVIPVMFVPGMMGTNLRVRRDVALPENHPLEPGEAAWRPPNGDYDSWHYADLWKERSPAVRQMILHPDLVEVDDGGELDIDACRLHPDDMRERGWGQLFNGAYGHLLYELQSHLDLTFRHDALGKRHVRSYWKDVMLAMQGDTLARWGVRSVAPLTEAELERFARYQYPIYCFGYNWLRSCGESAQLLQRRIETIIAWWQARKHQCSKVILVTHSMGGLVARACAKRIPDKIAGVVHGMMPALGAPLAYRRLACGTECDNPANGMLDNYRAGKFADISGRTTEETTPVLAASVGALELLPNHLYPRPWLHIGVKHRSGSKEILTEYLQFPGEAAPNPYDFYRDMKSWYRLINPALVDPARLYESKKKDARAVVNDALLTAEHFHRWLGDYYHPTTFAYYGHDQERPAYSHIHWSARVHQTSTSVSLTSHGIQRAGYLVHDADGTRTVEVDGMHILSFSVAPQDASGDDTVSHQSGAAPAGKIKQLFAVRGHRHQDSFRERDALLLTRYCIVKIVQELERHEPKK